MQYLLLFLLLCGFYVHVRSIDRGKPRNVALNAPSNVTQAPKWSGKMFQQRAEVAGNTVTFRCKSLGSGPIITTWYKNGNPLKKRGSRIGGYKFRLNNQLLVIPSVGVLDKGMYMCIVENQFGSINWTYSLYVEERAAHRPIVALNNVTVYDGDDAQVVCLVFSDHHPHVQLLKHVTINGSSVNPLTGTPYVEKVQKAEVTVVNYTVTFLLPNVTKQDEGMYTCLAGNAIGISHKSAWIIVKSVLSWRNATQGQVSKAAGGDVVLSCFVNEQRSIRMKWYKNGMLIQRSVGYQLRKRRQMLILTSLKPGDEGSYTCVASDGHRSIKKTFNLTVTGRIVELSSVQFVPIHVGESVRLLCQVPPGSFVKWLKHTQMNGNNLDPTTNLPYVRLLQTSTPNATGELFLQQVSVDDSGVYTCVVGSDSYVTMTSVRIMVVSDELLALLRRRTL